MQPMRQQQSGTGQGEEWVPEEGRCVCFFMCDLLRALSCTGGGGGAKVCILPVRQQQGSGGRGGKKSYN